ncbi:ribonuclease R family protein [Rubrobacter calidifluminis]|uniref:ribonuclease R family protein n=1 Tax=Rubrobacter calidifluminis TaxID=1392640 RepID=UPI0023628988|nr:VacB/RNase II family 3'-5' exoribonuclease [Rubrobacter calidifluminis]
MILPAVLVRRGKYSIADPLFVEERRPVLVARRARRGAEAGDLVLVDVHETRRSLRGEVVRVIGTSEDPRNVYEALFASIETSPRFPRRVEEEAEKVAGRGFSERRKDLRALPTVTIDGEDAMDFDDAISVERTSDGYRVWVHIADVTHYVDPEGALDREAARRGNSVYLPGRVAPMLPARLSADVCSLVPGAERAAVSVEMDVDHSGAVRESRIYRSRIASDARLTYEGVDAFLRGEGRIEQPRLVTEAYELSRRLKTRAAVRGKLELESREPEYELDDDGVPVSARMRESSPARELIEELMILANEQVAVEITGRPGGVFRVHERPDTEALEELGRRLEAIGLADEPSPENLSVIAQKAKSGAVGYLILRSLPRAYYSPSNVGHFGLALENYTHFTSPIRRYADILVHRALFGCGRSGEDLWEIAEHISEREFRSMICERTADEYTLMWLMRDRVGETFEGVVVSTTSFGLFVELESGATGLVHVSKLPGWWELDESGVVLSNDEIGASYRVGDRVLVELLDVFPLYQRAELRVVKRL